jgi:nitric oxide reductase NorD protein
MSDALAGLGDAHAIYGFSGNGRHDVEFHVAKDFTDAVSPASWAAIAAIEPRGSTRMGAAIRHAAARLARQPAGRRLLMVVSDGYPQDVDYGPDRGDETYGIQDTARALQEAARAGLATFCVTIDPAGHDYLRAMCPDRQYMVIDDVEALPAALAKVYLGLTDRG